MAEVVRGAERQKAAMMIGFRPVRGVLRFEDACMDGLWLGAGT
jgi:hypothetical protein